MFAKERLMLFLLVTALPAGCLPGGLLTGSGLMLADTIRPARKQVPGSTMVNVGFVIVSVALVLLIWTLWRRFVRRSAAKRTEFPLGLSASAWRAMLWSGWITGFAIGVVMAVQAR